MLVSVVTYFWMTYWLKNSNTFNPYCHCFQLNPNIKNDQTILEKKFNLNFLVKDLIKTSTNVLASETLKTSHRMMIYYCCTMFFQTFVQGLNIYSSNNLKLIMINILFSSNVKTLWTILNNQLVILATNQVNLCKKARSIYLTILYTTPSPNKLKFVLW